MNFREYSSARNRHVGYILRNLPEIESVPIGDRRRGKRDAKSGSDRCVSEIHGEGRTVFGYQEGRTRFSQQSS